jgi:hypothetical protein
MAEKIKLLFLASNPKDTSSLRLGEEIREIEEKLLIATHARAFEVVSKWAVRPNDLVVALMRHKPTIVHFSGHAQQDGVVVLEDDSGQTEPITKQQLRDVFSVLSGNIRLVVLNACFSDSQLSELSSLVDYTIGTSSAIGDKGAIQFAACFYQALAFGGSVREAFEIGKCQVQLSGISHSEVFTLRVKEGIDDTEPFIKQHSISTEPSKARRGQTTRRKQPQKVGASINQRPPSSSTSLGVPSARSVSLKSSSEPPPLGPGQRIIADGTSFEIIESLQRFRADYPDPEKVAFLMMRFGKTEAHKNIIKGIKTALDPVGISVVRADDKQYHDDLLPNVLTYAYGCSFAISVFERIETEVFNPNVALEVGYMLALRKHVCLLKDRTLTTLHADLVGKLYKVFDPLDPIGTIPPELSQWLKDKGLPKRGNSGSID